MLSLKRFGRTLSAYQPKNISRVTAPKGAAVAALLRFEGDSTEVLLMKRVDRTGDRWSGHVSFPGGRVDPGDADHLAAAIRETREEMGIDLEQSARLLGRLDQIRAIGKGKFLPMAITPFVFAATEAVTVELNEEAEAHFWLPLDRALSGELDSTYEYKLGPLPMHFPCWRFENQVVWGLTYRMLSDLLKIVTGTPGSGS